VARGGAQTESSKSSPRSWCPLAGRPRTAWALVVIPTSSGSDSRWRLLAPVSARWCPLAPAGAC
jgi:hypothetical protein